MYTTVQRWGNSNAIRLPKTILETAKLAVNERVEIIAKEGTIMILPAKRSYNSLEELFEGYEGTYDFAEIEFGRAGRELF